MWRLLVLCLWSLCAQAQSAAPTEERLREVAYSRAWLRQIHYVPATFGGYYSQLDGPGFFFSPQGRTDPLAELKASLQAFHDGPLTGQFKLHPQCAFPERFRFVRETLGIPYSLVPCPKYQEYLAMFHGPKAVSVVFSSAFPNNPASMFGHTFLKIKTSRKNDLLNMGVNFAAYTPADANMLVFLYQGVFGGYRGSWSLEPYFTKVNEYVNSESRDLWEYHLNFSEEETLRLLAHLWELETNSYFDYYFFDYNCSYQILRAIEAVKLDWDLSQHHLYVIPGETIKRLTDIPGAVTDVSYRASLFHQLQVRYESLSGKERHDLNRLLDGEILQDRELTPEVLDTALAVHLYRRSKLKRKWSKEDQGAEDKILALRARLSTPAKPVETPERYFQTRPELGHDPTSIFLGGGYLRSAGDPAGGFARLRFRSSYQDLLGHDLGYAPFSEIEFPSLELQWFNHQARVYDLGLLNITSLFPMSTFSHPPSWRVKMGLETDHGLECGNCLLQTLEVGAGATFGGSLFRIYSLGLARAETQSQLALGYRLRGGVETGLVWNPLDPYKTKLVGRVLWELPRRGIADRDFEFSWDHSFALSRNQELREINSLVYDDRLNHPSWTEFQLQWVLYFR